MAGEFELVLRAPRAVTAAGEASACVAVRDGRVAAVELLAAGLAGRRTVTLTADEVLLPGLVDSHVHVNEPGRAGRPARQGPDRGRRRRRPVRTTSTSRCWSTSGGCATATRSPAPAAG